MSTDLIYVEFRSRLPQAELALFHGVAARKTDAWDDIYPDDRQILNLARTWRLGPSPAYLTIYHTPAAGLERLNHWEDVFASGDVSFIEAAANLAFRIDRAGCYRPLLEPTPGARGPFYVEHFTPDRTADDETIARLFRERLESHPTASLRLAAIRIGLLAPAPGGLAVWELAGYESIGELGGAGACRNGLEIQGAGVYAQLGGEVL